MSETLSDVLSELALLAPKRFRKDSEQEYYARIGSPSIWWPVGARMPRIAGPLVQAACQEEVDATPGWTWRMDSNVTGPSGQGYAAEIYTMRDDLAVYEGCADSPALAIATALRDAIHSEATA